MRGGWVDGGPVDEDSKLDRAQAHQVMRRLWQLLRPYRRQIAFASFVLVLQTSCLLAGPALVRYGMDSGLLAQRRRRARHGCCCVPGCRSARARDRAVRHLAREPDR